MGSDGSANCESGMGSGRPLGCWLGIGGCWSGGNAAGRVPGVDVDVDVDKEVGLRWFGLSNDVVVNNPGLSVVRPGEGLAMGRVGASGKIGGGVGIGREESEEDTKKEKEYKIWKAEKLQRR